VIINWRFKAAGLGVQGAEPLWFKAAGLPLWFKAAGLPLRPQAFFFLCPYGKEDERKVKPSKLKEITSEYAAKKKYADKKRYFVYYAYGDKERAKCIRTREGLCRWMEKPNMRESLETWREHCYTDEFTCSLPTYGSVPVLPYMQQTHFDKAYAQTEMDINAAVARAYEDDNAARVTPKVTSSAPDVTGSKANVTGSTPAVRGFLVFGKNKELEYRGGPSEQPVTPSFFLHLTAAPTQAQKSSAFSACKGSLAGEPKPGNLY